MKRSILFILLLSFNSCYAQLEDNKHLIKILEIASNIQDQYHFFDSMDTLTGIYETVVEKSDIKQLDKQVKKLYKLAKKYNRSIEKIESSDKPAFNELNNLFRLLEDHIGHIDDHNAQLHEYYEEYTTEDSKNHSYNGVLWKYYEINLRAKEITTLIKPQFKIND